MKPTRRPARKLVALFVVFQIVAQGCVQRQVRPAVPSKAHAAYGEADPRSLGDVIRSVYRISEENYASRARQAEKTASSPGRDSAASDGSEQVGRPIPESQAERVAAAHRHLLEGRLPEALEEVESLSAERLEDPSVQEALAHFWRMLGDPRRALHHARLAHTMKPDCPKTLELVAGILLELEEWSAAVETLERAVRVTPLHVPTLVRLGLALGRSDRLEEARRILEQALFVRPALPEARKDLALVKFQLGEEEPALHDLRALYPEAVALLRLGDLYRSQERWQEAQRAFSRALARDPKLAAAHVGLAEVESYLSPPAVVYLPPFSKPGPAPQFAQSGDLLRRNTGHAPDFSPAISTLAPAISPPSRPEPLPTTGPFVASAPGQSDTVPLMIVERIEPPGSSSVVGARKDTVPLVGPIELPVPVALTWDRVGFSGPDIEPLRAAPLRNEPFSLEPRILSGGQDFFLLHDPRIPSTATLSLPVERLRFETAASSVASDSFRQPAEAAFSPVKTRATPAGSAPDILRKAFNARHPLGLIWIVMLFGLVGVLLGSGTAAGPRRGNGRGRIGRPSRHASGR